MRCYCRNAFFSTTDLLSANIFFLQVLNEMRLFRFLNLFVVRGAGSVGRSPMLKFYNNFNGGAGFFNNNYNAFRKNIIGLCGGGCALLSLSLFGTSKKEEETKDEQSNLLLIREADLYFESGLVDNAYNVLRRSFLPYKYTDFF